MSSEIDRQPKQKRQGFLPMDTNLFDRFFISAVAGVAIHLLWIRFLEGYIDLLGATAISIVIGYLIVRKG